MTLLERLSIRDKLTAICMLTSGVALLLASATFMAYDVYSFRGRMVRDLDLLTEITGNNCAASLLFNDPTTAGEVLATLAAKPSIERALLYRASGTLFASYVPPGGAGRASAIHVGHDGHRFVGEYLAVSRSVRLDQEVVGRLVIVSDLRDLHGRLASFGLTVAVVLLVAFLVSLFLSGGFQRLVSVPILRLARAARIVAGQQDFGVRVPQEGRDEIAQLAAAFNGMLAQLENRDHALRDARLELERKVAELEAEIRERRRTEEALRMSEQQLLQAQKMEAVGRLAGGVAHDFNNLLTAIIGYGALLSRRIEPDSPLRHGLNEILKAADRAAGLTRQLLAFSRKQILAPRVLDLGAVVADLGSMLKRLIGEDVELVIQRQSGLGRLKADPGQIEQVILNLAINARDAMPRGGRLSLETENLRVEPGDDAVPPGDYIVLSVSDTGCGMSPEVMARMFEPFFTTKPPGQGTGLGLSTVYGIVRQSGGHVTAASEPGQGTTFRIYLPRVEVGEETPAAREGPDGIPRGRGETILVVEDEVQVRALVAETLRHGGYEVLESADGDTALRVADAHAGPIHLVLTDVVMPGLNGKDVVVALEARRPGLPALYMSGYTDIGIVSEGRLEEGIAFIQKPFSPAELLERIRAILAGESGSRAAA